MTNEKKKFTMISVEEYERLKLSDNTLKSIVELYTQALRIEDFSKFASNAAQRREDMNTAINLKTKALALILKEIK